MNSVNRTGVPLILFNMKKAKDHVLGLGETGWTPGEEQTHRKQGFRQA
jgi:hypothetical protein